MSGLAQRSFTLEDYWSVEMASPLRHEFIDGSILAMAGGSPRHNEVASNIQYALRRVLDDTPCRPVGADQRIRASDTEYTYADVTVYCGRIEVAPSPPPDTALNPTIVVEVLSDSTRAYDRGEKLAMYQRIASIQAIWLVEPLDVRVSVWTRGEDGWSMRDYTSNDEAVPVLDHSVDLSSIYTRVVT